MQEVETPTRVQQHITNEFKILVVDDEIAILDVVKGSLAGEGFHADTASDAKLAVESISNNDYDLVITDIRMPNMTGVELTEFINSLGKNTRVIYMTGFAKYETVYQAIKTQPFGYLEKPFTPKQIIQLTYKAFEQWQLEQEKAREFIKLEKTIEEKTSDFEFQHERLLAEKEIMRGLISQANFGLIAVDINQSVHILNHYGIEVLGINNDFAEAYHGLPLSQLVTGELSSSLQALFSNVMKNGKLCELINVDPATERERHILAYPIRFRNKTAVIVFVIHDITEKQILQKRLLQSAKLASIGELAAGVAHEINNPLGFVTSNCNRLTDYCQKLLKYSAWQESVVDKIADEYDKAELRRLHGDKKEEHDIDYIVEDINDLLVETRDGLTRVSKIVRDLKSFARVDDDAPELHNLNLLIDDALNLVRNEIKYKLEVQKNFGQLNDIQCFPNQLVQVFTNLFINASHAVEEHGLLKITTTCNEAIARVTISDNGCGIPKDIMPMIYDPFFTTKEQGKGTGLGLSISYGIIEKHGGKITVESSPGKGTTFTITLPYNKAETLEKDGSASTDTGIHHV